MHLYLWYGENDFEITQTLNSWVEVFNKKYSGLNVVRLDMINDSKETLLQELKNCLQVNSLFGSNKFIILKNFLVKESSLEIQELLFKYLDNLAEGFFVVFVQNKKPDNRTKIYKKIAALQKEKKAEIKIFELLKDYELTRWAKNYANKIKAIFSPEALELLVAIVGNDLWQLSNEIKKLENYCKGEMITIKEVNFLVKGKYNDDVFQMSDALGQKDKIKTLALIKDQISSGANEIYLLTMLVRQIRNLLMIKEAVENYGLNNHFEIAKKVCLHPYVVQKTLPQIRSFTFEALKEVYKKLLKIEVQLKTQGLDFKILFDKFVATL